MTGFLLFIFLIFSNSDFLEGSCHLPSSCKTVLTALFAHDVLLTIDGEASRILCHSQIKQKLKSLANSYFRDNLGHMISLKSEFIRT